MIRTYLARPPENALNPTSTSIAFPLVGSNGGRISYEASTLAMVRNTISFARYLPGHTLYRINLSKTIRVLVYK